MNIKLESLGLKIYQPTPIIGDLLISGPLLSEDWFRRSVVSIIEHCSGASTMGLVMNNRSTYSLNDALSGIDATHNIPLYYGGPLSTDRLFYIHTLGYIIPESKEYSPGLFINGNLRVMQNYINSGGQIDGRVRFFIGYSSWTDGQLRDELDKYVWASSKMISTPDAYLWDEGNMYWKKRVVELGLRYKAWLNFPLMPILN